MSLEVDFIYIVENESQVPSASRFNIHKETYTQNYTIPGAGIDSNELRDTSKLSASKKVALLIAAASFYSGPLTLLAAEASSTALSKLFSPSPSDSPEENVKKEIAEEEIDNFLVNHALTPGMARSLNLNFPPGHPRVGSSYRQHPLANRGSEDKSNLYIPEDKFDELLFEEREAELIRLLVNLGATNISISEHSDEDYRSSSNGEAGTKTPALGGGASISSEKSKMTSGVRQREFVLNPVKPENPVKINQEEYAWAKFEPSWQSLMFSREVGRCTKASVVLKEKTAFSNKKSGSTNFSGKLVDASLNGDKGHDGQANKKFVIEVSFYDQEQ